jgi:rubredoxin
LSNDPLRGPAVTTDDRETLAALGWTEMTLNVTCRRCEGFARVELTDFLTDAEDAAQWDCPRCRAKNHVPVLARVVAVHKVDA